MGVSRDMGARGEESADRNEALEVVCARSEVELPPWADRETLAQFFHQKMQPYHDELEDVDRGIGHAFGEDTGQGGFILVGALQGRLVGGVTVLKTGMKGYIPENLLLFIGVDPEMRNRGIGRRLLERAQAECAGPMKLHVEPENPALRLYERAGFKRKYVEMRYEPWQK